MVAAFLLNISVFLPFPVHLKSIFTAETSWKVTQVKTKFTLLTFVRSEEDDPLRPTILDIYLLYYLLRGLSPSFLLLGRVIINEWDFKPNAKAQVLAPTIYIYIYILFIFLNHSSIQNRIKLYYKNRFFCSLHFGQREWFKSMSILLMSFQTIYNIYLYKKSQQIEQKQIIN